MLTKRIKIVLCLVVICLIVLTFWFNKSKLFSPKTFSIILVGDSMTEVLGTNLTEFRDDLKKYYPNITFDISNYGFGSTNILSVQERLEKDSTHLGQTYPAILSKNFDLILIESFGHNPLSELPLNEGLEKQTQALDQIVKSIQLSHPKAKIIFVATIAPNRNRYGEGKVVLLPDKRHEWADERTAYIKNHIQYAQSHNIPIINIYEKSLTDGDGNIDLINTSDFIHPSTTGIIFISQQMADFLYNNKVIKPGLN